MFAVTYGPQFLKSYDLYSSTWVINQYEARLYQTRAEAEVVAFAVNVEVTEVRNVS